MKTYRLFFSVTSIISIIICMTIINTPAFSQAVSTDTYEKEITGKTVDGLMNVSSSIVKDSFVPMTHWKKKEYLITIVPAYFQVNKAYDDPKVKGKDLKGWAAALGGGYALNERLLFYGILASQSIKGKLYGKMYKDPVPTQTVEADMNYRSFFFTPGAGFEFLPGKWLSIPVYFGPFVQYYKLDVDLPRETEPITSTSIEVSAAGSGILYGLSGGFAISAKILDKLKITPYYLYIHSFNKPDADAEVTISSSLPFPPSETQTESLETENLNASMIGLSATFVSTRNISFSVSIGGYITSETGWYNEKFLNGLQMKSIVLAVTYTNSQSEAE